MKTSALSQRSTQFVPRIANHHLDAPINCGCDAEKVIAVHAYLREHFPDYILRDFHAPTRLMRAGLPMPSSEHHVVSLTHEGILPYSVVVLNEFWEHSVEDIEACLQGWNLAAKLGAYRIIIVSSNTASEL